MSSISSVTIQTAAPLEIHDPEIQMRRRLPAELSHIEGILSHSSLNDPLAESLRSWHRSLKRETNPRFEPDAPREFLTAHSSTQEIFTLFLQRLAVILLDPPVEQETPHPIAQHMTTWLQRFIPDFQPRRIAHTPPSPTDNLAHERMNRIVNRSLPNRPSTQINVEIIATQIRQRFDDRIQRIEQSNAQFFQSAEARLDQMEQNESDEVRCIRIEIENHERRIDLLSENIEALDYHIDRTNAALDGAKMARLQLERARAQLEKDIEDLKKKEKKKKLALTIAGFALTVAALYYGDFSVMLKSDGFKVTLPW